MENTNSEDPQYQSGRSAGGITHLQYLLHIQEPAGSAAENPITSTLVSSRMQLLTGFPSRIVVTSDHCEIRRHTASVSLSVRTLELCTVWCPAVRRCFPVLPCTYSKSGFKVVIKHKPKFLWWGYNDETARPLSSEPRVIYELLYVFNFYPKSAVNHPFYLVPFLQQGTKFTC
ncbi:hypothetical protein XENOCAPTIV_007786 [Xenoophorus captivus]|uniref:Uncharacterized protein n=1 Tax=Xenoophorus captivus TaxID=1517983 RepID=A0ABV0R8T4_9TELE